MQQIYVRKLNKPQVQKLPDDIVWVCNSFGLSSGRDIHNITNELMKEIVVHQRSPVVSSEILAEQLDISIGRVNHHLRHLINMGLVLREKRRLQLRGGSMKSAVQELRKDTMRIFDEIELIAEDIDERVGIDNR